MTGTLIVILSILAGMGYAATQSLDGAQTFIVCLFAWLVLKSLYHGVLAFTPRRWRR
jgi:hypothetical protein